MKALHPAQGWLVCRMEAAAPVTEGGIIKPESVLERERAADAEEPPTFRIVAVPEYNESPGITQSDVLLIYPDVGDSVLIHARAGACLRYGADLWIVRLDSVMCTVTSGEDN